MPFKNSKPGIKRFINQVLTNLGMAHDAIIESRVNQTRQSNKRQKAETSFTVGDKVYLSTQNLNLPRGRARKLMPKFIGPYKVTDSHPEISRYTPDLPPELKAQRIVRSFHVSLLHQYHTSDDAVFPKHEVCTFYDFGDAEDNEWLVDDIIAHKWEENNISFLVQWNLGDTTLGAVR